MVHGEPQSILIHHLSDLGPSLIITIAALLVFAMLILFFFDISYAQLHSLLVDKMCGKRDKRRTYGCVSEHLV